MKLAVGEVWVVHRPDMPGSYWHFQLVAETRWAGASYYVGLKCDVPPTSMQAVVFDQAGRSVEAGPFAYHFQLTRRSRSTYVRAVCGCA
jgi:hypothetical protein